ncbi:MAG: hypothetical protein WBF33_20070 [Candidatus Nitrosopolaris sp.]
MKVVKGFEHIVVLIAAITFLLIIMFITIRQVKRLPISFIIQILDNHGETIMLPDLRFHFRKYEVAESYAQFYRDMYGQQIQIGWCVMLYTIIRQFKSH